MKTPRLYAALSLAVALLAVPGRCPAAATNSPPKNAASLAADDLAASTFFAGPIQSFEVEIPPTSLQSLREDARKSVPATVRVGGERYESVGIHVKGSAGSRRGVDDNPALTVSFGKFKPGQTFHGLKKIHLNNSVQDGSRMNELIATEIYRRAGLPVSRVTHGLVKINGADQGVYVVKEGFDKTWLRRNFADPTGNLYDGGFLQDVDNDLQRDEGTGPEDRKDLRALAEAADTHDLTARREAFGRVLEVDRFLTFWATQNLLCDWDGYVYNHNNYRLYHEPRTGRFTFIPHGMDQMLGDIGFRLDRGASGIVARQLQELPGFRDRMIDRVELLLTNVFTTNAVLPVFAGARTRLQTALASRDPGEWASLNASIGDVQSRVLMRLNIARQQTLSRPRPFKFNAEGVAVVTGWVPRADSGPSTSDAGLAPDGTKSLTLEVTAPGATASWRKRLRLPAGNYVFEARVRSQGLKSRTDAQGAGIGVRYTGRKRTNALEKDADWTLMSEPIQADGERSYELVVEIRADAGRVWIDQGSLRVRRVPEK